MFASNPLMIATQEFPKVAIANVDDNAPDEKFLELCSLIIHESKTEKRRDVAIPPRRRPMSKTEKELTCLVRQEHM
jgi:hypothetical protein